MKKSVARVLSTDAFDPNAACLTSERQRSCCVRAIDDLSQAVAALESGVTLDAVNVCAECAVGSLLELTGEKKPPTPWSTRSSPASAWVNSKFLVNTIKDGASFGIPPFLHLDFFLPISVKMVKKILEEDNK